MYDILIKNGTVIDFAKNKKLVADVGIKNGKIIDLGRCTESSKETIDAEGLLVSPGFIDIHMHEEKIGNSADGDDYDIANKMLGMGVTTAVGGNCGINKQSVQEFSNFVDYNGAPINYLNFVGHNYLRELLGIDINREASRFEIEKMKHMIKKDIEDSGAIGISFGIAYSPGITSDEIVNLCKIEDVTNILLSAHYRADSSESLDSINELIEISKHTNLPMQISHIGSCSAFGYMKSSLDLIQNARYEGVDVAADCYPYDSFSTYIGAAGLKDGFFKKYNKTYKNILLTEDPYKGMFCDEILYKKARKEHPEMLVVGFVMNEDEVVEALKSPFVYVASDGLLNRGQGHPRAAGTFPKVLGKFVREEKKLDLIDALKKMTLLPAKRLGLTNKGDIRPGMDGDITIFNPNTISDNATYIEPSTPPTGIEYVIIGGVVASKQNKTINNRLGKLIRRDKLSFN